MPDNVIGRQSSGLRGCDRLTARAGGKVLAVCTTGN